MGEGAKGKSPLTIPFPHPQSLKFKREGLWPSLLILLALVGRASVPAAITPSRLYQEVLTWYQGPPLSSKGMSNVTLVPLPS